MRKRWARTEWIGGTRPSFPLRVGVVCGLLLTCLLLALPAGAQTSKGSSFLSAQSGSMDAEDSISGNSPPMDAMHRELKEKQARELRKQRYAQVVSNTEELLRLATELNAEVSASKSTKLTGSQLRTLARIEKLARNVKDGMATPVAAETQRSITPAIGFP